MHATVLIVILLSSIFHQEFFKIIVPDHTSHEVWSYSHSIFSYCLSLWPPHSWSRYDYFLLTQLDSTFFLFSFLIIWLISEILTERKHMKKKNSLIEFFFFFFLDKIRVDKKVYYRCIIYLQTSNRCWKLCLLEVKPLFCF